MTKAAACALALSLLLCGCAPAAQEDREPGIYTTVVTYSGEDDNAKYLEIAQRSQELLALLEEKVGAFVMDAYNYQAMDDDGTPLYTLNDLRYPEEIAPNGRTIRVSRNYFLHNPIETADGTDLAQQLVYEDNTLNLLVPQQYRELEDQIIEAHREWFYFEKVTAENSYNELAGRPERLELPEEELTVHIIYVKEGQRYFTYRADCAPDTEHWIEDPIVQVYTGNIHCNYAHSILSQWCYFPSEGETAAYDVIRPYVEQCGGEESVKRVEKAFEG